MDRYAADDRSKWRDTCKDMTSEQIQVEINRLEQELKAKKQTEDKKAV